MYSDRQVQVLRHGRWGNAPITGHVWIIRQDWDYFHEDFYDHGPHLDSEGFAYYALYGATPQLSEHSSRSPTCLSEAEAVARAESFGDVEWLADLPRSEGGE